jgi:hypothetical protein
MKPWCNYSIHRTTSYRRLAGVRRNKPLHGTSKRRETATGVAWWKQAGVRAPESARTMEAGQLR